MRMHRVGRFFLRLCLCVFLVWLGALLVIWSMENQFVFRPQTAVELWIAPPTEQFRDVTFTSTYGTTIHGWWLPRSDAKGAVLIAHGNGGNLSTRGYLAQALSERLGTSVLVFDYPGYGRSAGTPNELACYDAADAAYLWLVDQQKIPGDQIILLGESLGGGVAVDLAQRHPNRALVLVKTYTALPDVAKLKFPWLPVHSLMSNRFDNRFKLARVNTPVFITHGTQDSLIPFSHAQELLRVANPPKKLFPLEGMDHNAVLPPEFYSQLDAFLKANPR